MKSINKYYFIISILALFLVEEAFSQPAIWPVRKIVYALYTVNEPSARHKNQVMLYFYGAVDSNGVVSMVSVNNRLNTKTYFSNILTLSEKKSLHDIFDEKGQMKKFIAREKLRPREMYAGQYEFISVNYWNGKTDEISIIEPFMSRAFKEKYDILMDAFYGSRKKMTKHKFPIPPNLIKSVMASFKSSTYLPKIEYPGDSSY